MLGFLRKRKLKRIFEEYRKIDRIKEKDIGNVLKETDKGFFVPSNMIKVFKFFEAIRLQRYRNFIDLGSGDGRIVLVASLFTDAAGIEDDEGLYDRSVEIRQRLGIKAELIKDDFMKHDITGYDAVYMYPDKEIPKTLSRKFHNELRGDLLLYTDTFVPEGLETEEMDIDWLKFCICRNPKNI